ncbi:MAG TPA: hypothetical protein VH396_18490 [Chitinophagaceae bacterium]|jgi:hypothetical protein
MKPIILVIVSGAMLMLVIHQDTDNNKDDFSHGSKEHKPHIKVQEKTHDTEAITHNVNLWLDRLQ